MKSKNFFEEQKERAMAELELFHYYRQDVLGIRVNNEWFCEVNRDHTVLYLDDALKFVQTVRERCRKKFPIMEEVFLSSDDAGDIRKTYRICIYGKGGQIGMIFRLTAPAQKDVADIARAGPSQGLEYRTRFLKIRNRF